VNASKMVSSVVFNYIGTISVSLAGFITTPIILHALGKGDFGAWALISSIIGYTALLDLGVGLTVMRMVAERAHLPDRTELRTIASTGLVIYSAIGLVFVIAGAVAAPHLGTAFHMSGARAHEFSVALTIFAVVIGITFPAGLYTGINQGFGRFRQQNTIVVGQTLASVIASLVTVGLGGGLIPLACANAAVALGGFGAKIIYAARAFGIVPSPFKVKRAMARMLMGVSAWMFLINIANKVIWDTDNIVIGGVLGAVAVSHYAVALGPATAVRRVTEQFNTVSLTAASSMKAQRDLSGLRRLLMEGTRMVTIVIAPFFVLFLLWGHDFLRLWVGPSLESSAPTLVVLVLGMFASSVQATSTMVLLALERQRTMAYVAIVEAVCNIGLSIFLATRMGILGVALGTAIPTSITAFGFYVPYAARLLELPLTRIAKRLVLPVSVAAAAYAIGRVVAPHVAFGSLIVFCAVAGVFVLACIAASMLLDREERATYIGVAQSWGRSVFRTSSGARA
jgi:O-antigen/teichoic acid export membrane protein